MLRADGFHVAIIMDGNGRWAQRRCMPRTAGHKVGVDTVRDILPACKDLEIKVLTLYAFSCDNWKRPQDEVFSLMRLMRDYLEQETQTLVEKGIRLNVIGRRDRIRPQLLDLIARAEQLTAGFDEYVLRIAVDYSARHALLEAARSAGPNEDLHTFTDRIQAVHHANIFVPPVDLLIRTGGEHRLSDFQLWEAAYAELFFSDRFWPEFKPHDLAEAVSAFRHRQRRFGGVLNVADGSS